MIASPSASAAPAVPQAVERVGIRDAVLSLGRLGARGHIGIETLTSTLREVASPTLRLLAYAVGLRIPSGQSHAELAARCVPVFRQEFKRTVLRVGGAPARAEVGPNPAPGAWHRLRV